MDENNSFFPDITKAAAPQRANRLCKRSHAFRLASGTILLAGLLLIQTGCKSLSSPKAHSPSGTPSPEMVSLQNQLYQTNQRYSALELANAQLNTQLAQAQQNLVYEQQSNQAGRQEYAALKEANQRLRTENQELQTKIAQMAQQAQGMIELGTIQPSTAIVPNSSMDYGINFKDIADVQTRRLGLDYRVMIPSDKVFADDKITVSENGKLLITKVMDRINEHFKNPGFRIEAHVGKFQEVSSSDPTLNSPESLTSRQAANVSEALKNAGVPLPQRTVVAGCGSSSMLVSADAASETEQQANQRIEFVVTP